MSCHPRVTEWTQTIQMHMPHLSKSQATVLALWSLGMVLARSCALSAVSAFLAPWLGRKANTVRQQLREFCYEAAAKRGSGRCALRVETCFLPLLAWVVGLWQSTQVALALDATTLGTRFTVLVLSVVYRGCAIPIVWVVLSATAKHAWRREWLRMLRQVHRAIPRSWTVIVLAERGLYARWLFRRITRLGWHPFLRINTGGTFRPKGQVQGVSLKTLVPKPGTTWQGTGIAFKGRDRQLHCTLLARWELSGVTPSTFSSAGAVARFSRVAMASSRAVAEPRLLARTRLVTGAPRPVGRLASGGPPRPASRICPRARRSRVRGIPARVGSAPADPTLAG